MESAARHPLMPVLSRGSYSVIIFNLVPLLGVILLGWEPISVFLFYALETIVVGIFNIFRLLVVYRFGLPARADETGVSGLGIIPFFMVHYFFFVFVQLGLFFGAADMMQNSRGIWHMLLYYTTSSTYSLAIMSLVANNLFLFINEFMLPRVYERRTMAEQMFEPYGRIFVQQFVVILGSFIFVLSKSGLLFLIIFVVIKIYFDLVFTGGSLLQWAKKAKEFEAYRQQKK